MTWRCNSTYNAGETDDSMETTGLLWVFRVLICGTRKGGTLFFEVGIWKAQIVELRRLPQEKKLWAKFWTAMGFSQRVARIQLLQIYCSCDFFMKEGFWSFSQTSRYKFAKSDCNFIQEKTERNQNQNENFKNCRVSLFSSFRKVSCKCLTDLKC